MYVQITGKAATPRDTPELQLLDLKSACERIRVCVVLDGVSQSSFRWVNEYCMLILHYIDVWDALHCKYFDCVDSLLGSKLLVTVKHSRCIPFKFEFHGLL